MFSWILDLILRSKIPLAGSGATKDLAAGGKLNG